MQSSEGSNSDMEYTSISRSSESSEPTSSGNRSQSQDTISVGNRAGSEPEIEQISASFFQLYKPQAPSKPKVDIFFFHGSQPIDASGLPPHLSTWTTSDGSQIWARSWIPEEFPDARILSVSYGTHLIDGNEAYNCPLILENLLLEFEEIRTEKLRPLILVGHSFGNLVIQRLCVYSHQRTQETQNINRFNTFLFPLHGIFGYFTVLPVTSLAWVNFYGEQETPFLRLMKAMDQLTTSSLPYFDELRTTAQQWKIYGIYETKWVGTTMYCADDQPTESSEFGDNLIHANSLTDYVSISRPINRNSIQYRHLIKFLASVDIEEESKL